MFTMRPSNARRKPALQHPHESRQHNQIHLHHLQRLHKCAFGVLVQLRAEISRRNEMCGNFPLARPGQNSRAFDVAQDDADLRRNFSRGAGNGNRDKVRAFAGTQHAQSEFIAHADLNSRVTAQNKWKQRT